MTYYIDTFSAADSGENELKECLRLIRDGYAEEALLHVQRALKVAPQNPFCLSYAGLLLTRVEQRFANAEMLCRAAIEMRPNEPQLYLNLAEVYQTAGQPRQAAKVLEQGLHATGNDAGIQRALHKCGQRRHPVLTCLHRSHPMNRLLGKWRHRLIGPTPAP